MLFRGIGRTFSTENDQQYETIGAFWDKLAAKYGRVNLQGLGYGWKARSIEYVIGLIDEEIDGEDRTVTLPNMGWVTVRGRTAELGKICAGAVQGKPFENMVGSGVEYSFGEWSVLCCDNTSLPV